MMILALIGAKALYLLFAWLISAAAGGWLSDRKGYGERLGLAAGLLLSVAGLVVILLLPGRAGSRWKRDGMFGRRGRQRDRDEGESASAAPPETDRA